MTLQAVFPLSAAYLPGDRVVLHVFEDRFLSLVSDVCEGDGEFLTVLIARGSEVGGDDVRLDHGVTVRIDGISDVPARSEANAPAAGGLMLAGTAVACRSVVRWLPDEPYPRAETSAGTVRPLRASGLSDVASSLSLLAQRTRSILEAVAGAESPPVSAEFLAVAAGRWWTTGLSEEEAWRAFWIVARQVPCGPLDRFQFLRPGDLAERTVRLKSVIEHVAEIVAFRFGQ